MVRIVQVELTEPAPALPEGGPARLLVRDGGRPVAFLPVTVPAAGLAPDEVTALIRQAAPDRAATLARASATPGRVPTATVVVTTCVASASLARTLRGVRAQTVAPVQTVVVDNRPATSGVAEFLAAEGFTEVVLVREPQPGLSRARNAGLAAATGEIVAYTDDDVVLDSRWVESLTSAFAQDERIACVTGLILPLELATPAQLIFEEFGGFAKGFQVRDFDLHEHRGPGALYPYAAGVFGTGANSSFRVADLRALGGFDETLGMGTPALGGEDLDIHLSVVRSGRMLRYEPAALVWHRHHPDERSLRRQIHSYGVGMAAMVAKRWATSPQERRELAGRLVAGLRHLLGPGSPKNAGRTRSYPVSLTVLELAGVARGPFAYLHSRVRGPRKAAA
ncbi:hypothetical protein GCM10010168_30820 [Actinoplanes ianthinogenes]|uniref:Glycosyltransferase 2-like domain-containing protein n=1 Tax=Actinoplanes ianthinogenes TaxID=122358 RepID=A0ABN6C712_9ACTN|nr:glycosyltransferase [Actinoplanes ianthinogenes]BCJ40224.1 hypothetical protein Aiant_08810 [Actinoplanes ianthinogenes]GGR11077.1 hypothetical protein GCM10010168_30820 [Actinoplanes ianthinogenes]